MDRLRALEVFIEIAETGSLSGAARKLSLSAPTVTRVLGDFEADLGVLLFHRTTRAVTLTDPGRTFLLDAKRIVSGFEEARDAVRGAHRAPKGLLRLTAPVLFGQHYILPVIMKFLDTYESVKAEAVFLDRVVNLVEEDFDLAVRIGGLAESSMMATRLGAVRQVICGHPNYFEKYGVPKTPSDLIDHRIAAVRQLSPVREWHFSDGISAKINPRLWTSSVQAGIETAKSGWGLTRVLSYQIGPDLSAGQLQTVLTEYEPEPLPIHIVHAEGRTPSAKVRAFTDMARDLIRNNPFLNR